MSAKTCCFSLSCVKRFVIAVTLVAMFFGVSASAQNLRTDASSEQ